MQSLHFTISACWKNTFLTVQILTVQVLMRHRATQYLCATNLLTFLEYVTACIDSKIPVDTFYLDLAKAFNKVPHQCLLLKLKAHGIDGLVYHWIQAWLADRWQRVCLNGSYSTRKQVWSGVSEGRYLALFCFSYSLTTWTMDCQAKYWNLQMIPNFFAQSKVGWFVVTERLGWCYRLGREMADAIQRFQVWSRALRQGQYRL